MQFRRFQTKLFLTSALAVAILPIGTTLAVTAQPSVLAQLQRAIAPPTAPPTAASPTASPSVLAQVQPSPPTTQSRFDAELLQLTNEERHKAGVPALQLSPQLDQAAQGHAEDMVRNNFFSHTGSNGSTLVTRVEAAGYVYSFAGENIAAGRATPAQTIQQWMNSPGHRQNMLNRNFTQIGFGYVSAPSTAYRHYWVQVFGTPMTRR
jgi:uncharacterized protein YkwD